MHKNNLFLALLFIALQGHALTSQDALPGVLHTNAAERLEWGEYQASFATWWMFDDDEYFKKDRLLIGNEWVPVQEVFSVSNYLALGMGVPGGFALSATLPFYGENTRFDNTNHSGLFWGDLRIKGTWTTHKNRSLPWLSSMIGVSTNLATANTGEGYVVRELEYAYSEEGCYLYSCGSRNTGLQFMNTEIRSGFSVDFALTNYQWPLKIHSNLLYRTTGLFSPTVGIYTAKNADFFNILGLNIAGEYRWSQNLETLIEYRHEQRRQSDFDWQADMHQMSYAMAWNSDNYWSVFGGVAHGFLNDGYAKAMYATQTGENVARYQFKTPDIQFFAGVSLQIGKVRDKDKDGVVDSKDVCPHTPAKAKVDVEGCAPNDERDSDLDGVPDVEDKCPKTPKGVAVNNKGCPLDADQDGVIDSKDQCLNTPKGVKVDNKGCPLDTDQDGVLEAKDQCPNTLKSVKVNAQGCPLKETQDLAKLQKQINFEVGSDKIVKGSFPVLDNLAKLLLDIPDVIIEVQGHTDSDGKAAYNLDLSQRRAESVVRYLVKKGVQESRLIPKGYGITKPIADNRTLSGKKLNRRVELIPVDEVPK